MGIIQDRRSVWKRSLAFFCLAGLVCLTVVHSGHFSFAYFDHESAEFRMFSSGDSLCPACVAIHSSVAEPPFYPASNIASGNTEAAAIYESAFAPPGFFHRFVRSPPVQGKQPFAG
jgi:hypothetical protein